MNQSTTTRCTSATLLVLSTLMPAAVRAAEAVSEVPFIVLEDTLVVRAARASEADNGESMVFEGGLELHANDWRIEAERAVLAGRLDDPERVIVDGDPARIIVAGGKGEPLEGRGQHLEYEPHTDTVRLDGAAMIVKGEQSISSESIQYLLGKGTFAAGSHGRVRVVMKRDK